MSSEKYNPKEFEKKWQEKWLADKLYKTPEADKSKEKYYSLYSYPYPSGAGLHVGHVEGMVANDIMARYYRLKGRNVTLPMGWDAFGLPAENYAIKTGVPPRQNTDEAIKTFINQINNIGISVDWDMEVGSHESRYYKWTQWIFLQMYKHGLAYKKKAPVNWCPKDETVLANEQVVDGKCERCDTPVVQKEMEQWFYKITEYADRLIDDLEKVNWPESTKSMQKNWIGKSEGAEIVFDIVDSNGNKVSQVDVFTTRADTLFSGAFIVLAPENKKVLELKAYISNISEAEEYISKTKLKTELERQQEKEKSGVKLEGIFAINPINNAQIPVYLGDFVLATYGSGAVFGDVHDERDFEFVKKFNIPAKPSIIPEDKDIAEKVKNLEVCFTDYGILIDSDEFTGMRSQEARVKIVEKLEKEGKAKFIVNYRLRDWLLSRQRYWGAPIPIVYDPEGNAHAIDEKDLPLLLPEDVDFKPTGESPVARSESFKKAAEEKYGKGWHYEVDTMDTFVDSSWYFLRYFDVNDDNQIFEMPDASLKFPKHKIQNEAEFLKTLKTFVDLMKRSKFDYYIFGSTAFAGLNRAIHKDLNDIDVFVDNKDIDSIKSLMISEGFNLKEESINEYNHKDLVKVFEKDGVEIELMGFNLTSEYLSSQVYGQLHGITFRVTPIQALVEHYKNRDLVDNVKFLESLNTKPNYWMPTDLYLIGAEHAVLHCLYARFFTKFMFDQGWINFDEPFYFMRHMGTILGTDSRKMSKRWGNVLNPNDEINTYGADTLRMYEMFMGPLEEAKPWNDRAENGVFRFISKVWDLQEKVGQIESKQQLIELNKTIKKVSEDIESLSFNTAVAKLMEFNNFLQKEETVSKDVWEKFLIIMSPFAPFVTEELWARLGNEYSVHTQSWPSFDESLTKDEVVTIAVQVNGKVRGTIQIQAGAEESTVVSAAKEVPGVQKYLTGEPKKVVYVKDRILSFIV